MLSSYSPILSAEKTYSELLTTQEISQHIFEPSNSLVKCDPKKGKYMACSIMYRGDIIPKDVSIFFSQLKNKRTINFIDWCSTGMKVGINYTAVPG